MRRKGSPSDSNHGSCRDPDAVRVPLWLPFPRSTSTTEPPAWVEGAAAASADPGQALSDRLLRLLHIFPDVLHQAGRQLVLQFLDLFLLLLELLRQPLHVLLKRADTPGELTLDAPDLLPDRFLNGHVCLLPQGELAPFYHQVRTRG